MDDRDVITLEVVVDVDLPVAVDHPVLARGERAVERSGTKVAEEIAERRSGGVEVDEQQAIPTLNAKLRQRDRRLLPALDALHLRRRAQRSIERVGPSVIAALQRRALARSSRDRTGAMTADVRQRANFAVVAANDQQRLVGDIGREELAALAHLILMTDELPGAAENRPVLRAEDLRVVVVVRRDRGGAGKLRFKSVAHVVGGA